MIVIEIKGITRFGNGRINHLYRFLYNNRYQALWNYYGLRVELDPTVDFIQQNMLVRWLDIDEGFNDKIIVNSLEEFQSEFTPLND